MRTDEVMTYLGDTRIIFHFFEDEPVFTAVSSASFSSSALSIDDHGTELPIHFEPALQSGSLREHRTAIISLMGIGDAEKNPEEIISALVSR